MELPKFLESWSWLAGIASVVVGVAALWYQVRSAKKQPDSSSSVPPGTQIGHIGGNYTVNNNVSHSHLSPQQVQTLDIPGRWDLEAAKKICMRHLEAADWNILASDLEPPINHEFVGSYFQTYKIKEEFVLIFSSITVDMDCHACAPYLSFFEFVKQEAGWGLNIYDIAAYKAGSWGKPPDLSVRVIGEEKYAVFMEGGYMAQGWTVTDTSIHARIGDSFKEIFNLLTSQGDPEGNGWSGTISLIPTTTGFYDIAVTREGIRGPQDLVFLESANDFKLDVADLDDKVRPHDVFKFDGQRYRRNSPVASYR
jgi:hypothetical protein